MLRAACAADDCTDEVIRVFVSRVIFWYAIIAYRYNERGRVGSLNYVKRAALSVSIWAIKIVDMSLIFIVVTFRPAFKFGRGFFCIRERWQINATDAIVWQCGAVNIYMRTIFCHIQDLTRRVGHEQYSKR
jgi:hypothetical protein